MRFLTTEDFDLEPYNLPAKVLTGSNFSSFADRVNEQALREVLGDLLYEAFVEAIDEMPAEWDEEEVYGIGTRVVYGNSIWESSAANNEGNVPEEGAFWLLVDEDNRWLLLQNGTRYFGADGVRTYRWKGLRAALTPYVFSMWLNESSAGTATAIGGITNPKAENGEQIFPASLICREFNNYSSMIGDRCDMKNTLYGYLYYSAELYLDVIEAEYTSVQYYLRERFNAPGEMNPYNL